MRVSADRKENSNSVHMIYFVIFQLPFCTFHKDRDLDWAMEVERARPVDCVPVGSMDPAYILYTSGTTGLPKVCIICKRGFLL
jgi:acyl-coenzyme A synthetase/AMP-(fatty) acid ligase